MCSSCNPRATWTTHRLFWRTAVKRAHLRASYSGIRHRVRKVGDWWVIS